MRGRSDAPASYYRSSIDPFPMLSQLTLRNHYIYGALCSRPLKTHPVVKEPPSGAFFLDGKCRRHKCLFDLMTRCPIRAWPATHTREHLSPSLRSFRVSVGRTTGPYVALLILLKKRKEQRKKRNGKRLVQQICR